MMPKLPDYRHVAGLAEIAKRLREAGEVEYALCFLSHCTPSRCGVYSDCPYKCTDRCQYCGTPIKILNIFYVGDFLFPKASIVVGSVCARHLSKYLDIPEERLEFALKYFRRAVELLEKAEEGDVGAAEALQRLVAEARERKVQFMLWEKVEARERIAKAYELLEKVDRRLLTDWEVDFVVSVRDRLVLGVPPT
ncbi:MAG: hypothetical protein DRJ67_05280, partial [Thermoprotei archaeon]